MPTFTVLGTRDENGELTVAGVVDGRVFTVDADHGPGHASRYAAAFEAEDPEEAEALAVAWCDEND
jgi:hypothetical protein